ncbi:MAG: cysteine desulfurase CsdA [Thalassobius sp.]|nr:cysteine desulfurase CsdA [Thalassovita sp.]
MIDIKYIREQFPAIHQEVNGFPLIYFDNAATSQKPKEVIDALNAYYEGYNSNVHRGAHTLAAKATDAFEDTRESVRAFLGAKHIEEIIFTKGTTESINLVAYSFGRKFINEGDEIIISGMEHHSNIVPWQILCEEKGAKLNVIPVKGNGELDYEVYESLVSEKTKLVAVAYVSNSLGTINDVKRIIAKAKSVNAKVLLDGAQSSPHCQINVAEMDCDFYAFSGHKVYGPTGIGALYGKKEILEAMPPFLGGGEMIKEVTFAKTTFNDLPYKFEAGTPNIGDTVALKNAIDFVNRVGKEEIAAYELELLEYATDQMKQIAGIKLVGTAAEKVGVISFLMDGVHHFDLGMMLDARGIAIRTGHHCTQPLMSSFGIDGTARVSFAVYNTKEEVDVLVEVLQKISDRFVAKTSKVV